MKTAHQVPLLACLACSALLSQAVLSQAAERRYGYVRQIEGRAVVVEAETGTESEIEAQIPLLSTDRLRVSAASRLDAVLADHGRLRVDADTEVELIALAASADSTATQTVLGLPSGRIHYVVPSTTSNTSAPIVQTSNATVYLQNRGTYLVASHDEGWTQVVVRAGYAEVVTDLGSSIVRGGEQALVSGLGQPTVEIRLAPQPDAFELWAGFGEVERTQTSVPQVGEGLQYEASSLDGNGAWVEVGGAPAWRPHVSVGWRPYSQGHWSYTPTGLTWVSLEPWGWLPYHYGSWDLHSHYGWLWYPGSRYATAHVHWYWGSLHVGWIPSRYYNRHYYRYGYDRAQYAHGHGSWRDYTDWTFVPTRSLGHRGQHRAHHDSSVFRDRQGGLLPNGQLTDNTSGMRRAHWRDPGEAQKAFRRQSASPRGTPTIVARQAPLSSRSHPAPGDAAADVIRRGSEIGTAASSTPAARHVGRSTVRPSAREGHARNVNRSAVESRVRSVPAEHTSPTHVRSRTPAEPAHRILEGVRSTRAPSSDGRTHSSHLRPSSRPSTSRPSTSSRTPSTSSRSTIHGRPRPATPSPSSRSHVRSTPSSASRPSTPPRSAPAYRAPSRPTQHRAAPSRPSPPPRAAPSRPSSQSRPTTSKPSGRSSSRSSHRSARSRSNN